MVQVYSPGNTDYEWNGDAVLSPLGCRLSMELNGPWELELELPLDPAGRALLLVPGAVVSAPTPFSEAQRFRVYDAARTESGVSAKARPVFLDAARDVFLLDVQAVDLDAGAALARLFAGTRYKYVTDLKTVSTASWARQNLIQALTDEEAGFLALWGGELSYDNETVRILSRQGADRDYRVEFGRNAAAIQETVNDEDVATRLVPVAFNGRTLPGPSPWVDSPLIRAYPLPYTALLDCQDCKLREDLAGEPQEGDLVYDTPEALYAALRARCQAEFAAGRDKPSVTYQVDMVELAGTQEYAAFRDLERVGLGDTVSCGHRRLGIDVAARVIALEYDCLRRVNTGVTLGDYRTDILQIVSRLDTRLAALTGSVSAIPNTVHRAVDAATAAILLGGPSNRSLSVTGASGEALGGVDASGWRILRGELSLQGLTVDGAALEWKTLADGSEVLAKSKE